MNDLVQFSIETLRGELYLPALTYAGVPKFRKLIKTLVKYSWQDKNTDTLIAIREWLSSETDKAEDVWHRACKEYRDGYELPTGHPLAPKRTRQEARRVSAQNRRLLASVKKTKAQYDKTKKFFEIFKEET